MGEGSGDGANKWILHLMGGGWCFSPEDCLQRSQTPEWEETAPFAAFLSSNATVNPDFYNWNSVFFVYCDGGIFSGVTSERGGGSSKISGTNQSRTLAAATYTSKDTGATWETKMLSGKGI